MMDTRLAGLAQQVQAMIDGRPTSFNDLYVVSETQQYSVAPAVQSLSDVLAIEQESLAALVTQCLVVSKSQEELKVDYGMLPADCVPLVAEYVDNLNKQEELKRASEKARAKLSGFWMKVQSRYLTDQPMKTASSEFLHNQQTLQSLRKAADGLRDNIVSGYPHVRRFVLTNLGLYVTPVTAEQVRERTKSGRFVFR